MLGTDVEDEAYDVPTKRSLRGLKRLSIVLGSVVVYWIILLYDCARTTENNDHGERGEW